MHCVTLEISSAAPCLRVSAGPNGTVPFCCRQSTLGSIDGRLSTDIINVLDPQSSSLEQKQVINFKSNKAPWDIYLPLLKTVGLEGT